MDKPIRPTVLGGITVRVVTGCGSMYVQMNWYKGKLFEVFATLGQSGGCAICQSGALTKSITTGLKYGVPVEEFIDKLRGMQCPCPMPFPKDKAVRSCPDAIAKTLDRYGKLTINQIVAIMSGLNGNEFGKQDVSAIPVQRAVESSLDEDVEGREAIEAMGKQADEREQLGLR